MKEHSNYDLETIQIRKSIVEHATKGNIDEFIGLVEEVLNGLSNRDFIKFDEKYIKFVILTYLGLSKAYDITGVSPLF